MIPLIANIRKAIYYLNKRIDQLDNQIKDMLGLDSSSIQSLINILNDKDTSTGILNILLQKADKSEIPAAQIQSDWNQQDDTKLDYIKNKPTIPTVPTDVSAFTNDAGYLTGHQDLSSYALKSEIPVIWTGTQAQYDALDSIVETTIYIIKDS